jgi:TonB family protein
MLVRILCLLALVAPAGWAQGRPLFAPPKAKVVSKSAATPTPTPAPAAAPIPGPATTPKPAPRRPKKPADPLAAYMPTVKAAFAERWGEAVTPLLKDFNPGNVSVLFKLDPEGKVTDFSVTQNTSNEAFAKFCEQFVRETVFERPPEKALTAGQVEIPFTFWIY